MPFFQPSRAQGIDVNTRARLPDSDIAIVLARNAAWRRLSMLKYRAPAGSRADPVALSLLHPSQDFEWKR